MRIAFLFLSLILSSQLLWAQAELKKAQKCYENYEYGNAIPLLQKVLAKKPDHAQALIMLAECYRQTNQYVQAEDVYEDIFLNNFGEPIHKFYYGLMLRNNGKYADARKIFELYLAEKPGDSKALLMSKACDQAEVWSNLPAEYKVEKADRLNTKYSEFSPVPYKDGIIFATTRPENEKKSKIDGSTGQYKTDLYYSQTGMDGFGLPVRLNDDINTAGHEGPVSFSSDGLTVYYTRAVEEKGKSILKILIAKLESGKWTKGVPFEHNSENASTGHPSISKDGQKLYFASNREGGIGGTDLWVSEKSGDKWTAPKNLGPEVNTPGNESFPFIHSDQTLYFASDYHIGFGGMDLFSASYNGEIWTDVTNLQAFVNSSADDFGFYINEQKNQGYMSSNRSGGNGSDDIYYVYKIENENTVAENTTEMEATTDSLDAVANNTETEGNGNGNGNANSSTKTKEDDGNYVVLGGKVVEMMSDGEGNIDDAIIELLHQEAKVIEARANQDGDFSMRMSDRDNYVLMVRKRGYFTQRVNVTKDQFADSQEGNGKSEVNVKVQLKKILLNQRNDCFPSIYFDFDSAVLRPEAQEKLGKVINILGDNPEIEVELASYACPIGDATYNKIISEKRSAAVRNYLLGKGVSPRRVQIKGYGATDQFAKNASKYNENRRTDMIVRGLNADQSILAESEKVSNENQPIRTSDPKDTPMITSMYKSEDINPENSKVEETKTVAEVSEDEKIKATYHKVRKGETLWAISKKYNIPLSSLQKYNNLKTEKIQEGMVLKLGEK